ALLADLTSLLFSTLSARGLLVQGRSESLHLQLDVRLGGLQLLRLGFEPGLFGAGALLLRLLLLPGLFQSLLQVLQFDFQFAAALPNRSHLLLGAFPTLGFLGQVGSQARDLLLHLRLSRL